MKKTILFSAVAFSLLFGACGNSSTTKATFESCDTTKLKTGEAYYQCAMHPEVNSSKPGNCPKCGEMELDKKVKI